MLPIIDIDEFLDRHWGISIEPISMLLLWSMFSVAASGESSNNYDGNCCPLGKDILTIPDAMLPTPSSHHQLSLSSVEDEGLNTWLLDNCASSLFSSDTGSFLNVG